MTTRRLGLFCLAFGSGFAVLTIEISGARLIAPVFGLSAVPWTAVIGVILAAVYMLWGYERVFTGPITNSANESLHDLGLREIAIIVPLILIVLAIGIYPRPILDRIQPSVDLILERIEATTSYEVPEYGSTIDEGAG